MMEITLKTAAAEFVSSESGATAVEYGILAATISLAVIVALQATGTSLSALLGFVDTTISAATPTSG